MNTDGKIKFKLIETKEPHRTVVVCWLVILQKRVLHKSTVCDSNKSEWKKYGKGKDS